MKLVILAGAIAGVYYLSTRQAGGGMWTALQSALASAGVRGTTTNTTAQPGAQPAPSTLAADPYPTFTARRASRVSAY